MPLVLSEADMNERILELITDLGNMVLYKKALTELQKLKQRKPSAFRSQEFFKAVMALMEWNHYRLGVRRMVIDLFEKNVMRQIVFDEEESESSEDGGGQIENGSADASSSDDRTERQRSVSEPAEVASNLMPAPLKLKPTRS